MKLYVLTILSFLFTIHIFSQTVTIYGDAPELANTEIIFFKTTD